VTEEPTLRDLEQADPFAPHDPGCRCYPHVSQRAAIEGAIQAATAEYGESHRALATPAPAPSVDAAGLDAAWEALLRDIEWEPNDLDDLPRVEPYAVTVARHRPLIEAALRASTPGDASAPTVYEPVIDHRAWVHGAPAPTVERNVRPVGWSAAPAPTVDAAGLDAVEAAFIEAVNAPSLTGRGIAVPHYRDVEAIWSALLRASTPGDERAPWDHPYEAGSDNRCIHCGLVGSYAHTEEFYRASTPGDETP